MGSTQQRSKAFMRQRLLFDSKSTESAKIISDKKEEAEERRRIYDTYKQLYIRSSYDYIGRRYVIEQYVIDKCCELIEGAREVVINDTELISNLSGMVLSVTREPYTIVYLFTNIQTDMIDCMNTLLGDVDTFKLHAILDKAYSVAFYTAAKEKGFGG